MTRDQVVLIGCLILAAFTAGMETQAYATSLQRKECTAQKGEKVAYATQNIDGSLTCVYIPHVRGLATRIEKKT